MQTDLGAKDIAKLLCLGYLLKPEEIAPVDFPAHLFNQSSIQDLVLGYTFVWDVNFDLLRAYVRRFNRGSWRQTPLYTP
jgi:hypothetical protein